MRTRLGSLVALAAATALVASLAAVPAVADAGADAAGRGRAAGVLPTPGPPTALRTTVVPGQPAIRVTWGPPRNGLPLVLGYDVLLDGDLVASVPLLTTAFTITDGLELGHSYRIEVRGSLGPLGSGRSAATTQTLYIAPVTTKQAANPSNPLAGTEWGVYLGLQDPAMNGWSRLGRAEKDRLAPIAMMHKAKYFGRWVPDAQAELKTRQYIEGAQAGDPSRLTILTLFRMFPWEGEARIDKRLPTAAEQRSYRRFVAGLARGIGSDRVAVVLQPDGYFAKKAYDAHVAKLGRKKALLPARMLAWTAKTLTKQPRTTVYIDMGSEDWARGDVAPVAKFLKLSGVKYARGFSMNVSHKNYLEREILFAREVSQALAAMGLKGKHAVLDTSDNGHPFHGSEINPQGAHTPHYTEPGEIPPCRTAAQKKPCTGLGIPPTTDVDNPLWGLAPDVARVAATYVDAYLWVSRPWLPGQGRGGATFSPQYAKLLLKTWGFSPYFTGTP